LFDFLGGLVGGGTGEVEVNGEEEEEECREEEKSESLGMAIRDGILTSSVSICDENFAVT